MIHLKQRKMKTIFNVVIIDEHQLIKETLIDHGRRIETKTQFLLVGEPVEEFEDEANALQFIVGFMNKNQGVKLSIIKSFIS